MKWSKVEDGWKKSKQKRKNSYKKKKNKGDGELISNDRRFFKIFIRGLNKQSYIGVDVHKIN